MCLRARLYVCVTGGEMESHSQHSLVSAAAASHHLSAHLLHQVQCVSPHNLALRYAHTHHTYRLHSLSFHLARLYFLFFCYTTLCFEY